jgi:hypothetical protein
VAVYVISNYDGNVAGEYVQQILDKRKRPASCLLDGAVPEGRRVAEDLFLRATMEELAAIAHPDAEP